MSGSVQTTGVTVLDKPIESILSQEVALGSYRVRYGIVTMVDGRCFGVAYRHRAATPDVPWQTPTSRDFLASLRSIVSMPKGVEFPTDPSKLPNLLDM